MKKALFLLLLIASGLSAMAQQIQLRSADKAECVKSDMTSLKASFSFSTIEAEDYNSERGTFSWLSMANTVIGGNEGEPQIPVINQLIAVPFGAQPRIEITSYSTTDYRLEDLSIHTLVPRQPSLRKDKRPEDVPFVMNEAAYQTRGLHSEPTAAVSVEGTMRGVQLGTMTIEPVSYDPVNNTLRVFNDIEVEVHFDGADAQATEDMLLRTYSPAFDNVYAQLFNNRAITDVYTDHPDLYNTPVKMLVICYSGFQGNAALESWLQWKLQKGYYVDIYYTSETGTTASAIASFIKTKYNASVSAGNAYTYLIVIGDTGQVPQYMTKTVDESCASDLGYSSVNFSSSTSNYFPDMYYSRMSVENTTHLTNYINKVLTYERYEFTDGGNYLNNVILVGGWDSSWTARVAKPTINYATNYYFKSSNTTYGGFENGTISATISTSSTQGYSGTNNGCYNGINNGVCFLNYTAHGDKQEWYQPKMTAAHVATLTNTGKYFFGVGNCCLTGNFNNTSTTYSPGSAIGTNACFAETMIRVPNAGAVAYVGCSPYSYWYEDFYWAVGAHSYSQGNYPTQSASSKGVYDVMFEDQYWNSASALLYVGNLAVQQAVTNGNTTSNVTDGNCNNSAHYYFQFYHTFGDGSVMPYITKPEVNTVTIPSTVTPGTTSITVNAVAGSYVAVTDNSSVIYGVAEANSSGVATVNFTNAIPSTGTLYVVVTRQQYQPYFGTISIVGGTQYTITATASPSNGGTVSGAGQYYGNTSCTLTASPAAHYDFVNWKKGSSVVSTNPTYTFTVTENASFTANFVALQPHSVTCNPVENGSISANPTTAYKNETVTLSATPASGYFFSAWEVRDANNNSIAVTGNQFTMPDSDVTVSATFVQGCTVTIAEVEHGTVTATPTTAVPGTTITLTATPETNYLLSSWIVYKTGDVREGVTVTGNSFVLPAFDVTVVGIFKMIKEADVAIGNGSSTNIYLPTYSYYKYSLTQQIYTAAEIGQAGTITKIAFKVSNSKSTSRTVDVYLKHTTQSAFTSQTGWEIMRGSDKVYSGSVTFQASGWTTITLSTPFEYDGTSNLVLCVDDNTGSYVSSNSNSPQFYVYSTNANRAMRYYSDSTNPSATSPSSVSGTYITSNNQVTFTMTLPGSDASLAVSPNAMADFSYIEGNGPSAVKSFAVIGTYLTGDVTVTAPTDFEISDAENGNYGSSLTFAANRDGRETLSYDFEGGAQGWTTLKGSTGNSPNNWMHVNDYTPRDYTSGYGNNQTDGWMLSESYISASTEGNGTAVTPDNYLVSPQVTLGGSITFWVTNGNSSYGAEHFALLVSTTNNTNISSFTQVQEWTLAGKGAKGTRSFSDHTWYEYTVDLSAYSGAGYVAFRHFNCNDQWILGLDDVTIVQPEDNPVNPTDPTVELLMANVYVRLKEGLSHGSYANETLTVATGDITSNVNLNGEVTQPEQVEQTVTLNEGWNWWAPTVETTMEAVQAALGSYVLHIESQNGQTNGTIAPGQMLRIETNAECQLSLTGTPITSASITINQGLTWFGYVGAEKSIAEAFSGFTPTEGDKIVSQDQGFVIFNGTTWDGDFSTLIPGRGYVYISNTEQSRMLSY